MWVCLPNIMIKKYKCPLKPSNGGNNNIMMGDPLTSHTNEHLHFQKKVAVELESIGIGTEHLLVGIITLGQGVAVNALLRMGVRISQQSVQKLKRSKKE